MRVSIGPGELLCVALLIGGSDHIAVGLDHLPTNFALLSLAAGIAQLALGFASRGAGSRACEAAAVLSLILVQFYVLNVTTGLPMAIAHTHVAGTHEVYGLTLSWPNPIDRQGIVAVLTELTTIITAWRLTAGGRSPAPVSSL